MKRFLNKHMLLMRRFLCALLIACAVLPAAPAKQADAGFPALIALTAYRKTLNIGEEFLIVAVASNGKIPTFRSSSSRIASVSKYGRITAKAAGSCRITAKAGSAEASCAVTVAKTTIRLNQSSLSLEHGETFRLTATTSNGSIPVFKSSKKSVATVEDDGTVTALKPGTATIRATADKTTQTCKVTVRKPTVTLSAASYKLYRGQTVRIEAAVSSGITPVWKSSKKSVASVDENGLVTAYKHGVTIIRATVDGITRNCEITVASPEITLAADTFTVKAGKSIKIGMTCSSGNAPVWKSSKKSVATVDQNGRVKAKKAGSTTITVTEDGTKETCVVRVV